MSFILDALKKSESDRQRQTGPALFEVKVAPPKPRFPFWALALAALLVINIAIGAWVFLRRPQPEPASAPQAATPPAAAPQQSAPPQQTGAPLAAPLPAPRAAATVQPPPSPSAGPAAPPESRPEPVLSGAEYRAGTANPDDYAPAVEPQRQRMDGVHVTSGTESGFKSYADAQANPDLHLPVLRVDLHVYAANPQERFVLINMRRLHEGDTLPEGGHLESITPDGVVVSYQGTKFFLEHE